MLYEVEMKFPLEDPAPLEAAVKRLGGVFSDPVEESDRYYRHPSRDFIATDEALRLRRKGGELRLTYKGPRIDLATKTRAEIDLPLFFENRDDWVELLEKLGFEPAGAVLKYRRSARLKYLGHPFEIVLDEIPELSPNSHFLEIETLAEESEIGPARNDLLGLAVKLSLDPAATIRTSYLRLLEERRNKNRDSLESKSR